MRADTYAHAATSALRACQRCGHRARIHEGRIGACQYGSCTCDEFADEESIKFLIATLLSKDEDLDKARQLVANLREVNKDLTDERNAMRDALAKANQEVDALRRGGASIGAKLVPGERRPAFERPSSGGFSGND